MIQNSLRKYDDEHARDRFLLLIDLQIIRACKLRVTAADLSLEGSQIIAKIEISATEVSPEKAVYKRYSQAKP